MHSPVLPTSCPATVPTHGLKSRRSTVLPVTSGWVKSRRPTDSVALYGAVLLGVDLIYP